MLRFLSNYLFQNENQPNENDPTTEISKEQQQNEQGGPSSDKQPDDDNRDKEQEFMDMEMRDDGEDDEDDWVLIGEKKEKRKEEEVEAKVVTVEKVEQPQVSLVAVASSEEEEEDGDDGEGDESSDEEDDEEEEEVSQGLLWENKLIEHPSMSVYVDLATSINSSVNGVTASCISLSSIAPATSPGESVIVLEQPDSSDEEEDMDFLESVVNEPAMPRLQKAEQVHLEESDEDLSSDTENNLVSSSISTSKAKPIPQPPPAPQVQNGRRKKGHYPCTSSNSSQMPRRAHLRNCAGSNANTMASSATSTFINNLSNSEAGANSDATLNKKFKRAAAANATSSTTSTTSACGIAIVNGAAPPSPTSNGMINKNVKLVEMFPTASAAAKRRHRRSTPPQKQGSTPKGHFLQEARRRQDLQNYTKHSCANNDRRSAQQRRVQKNCAGAAAGAGGGRGAKNTKNMILENQANLVDDGERYNGSQ